MKYLNYEEQQVALAGKTRLAGAVMCQGLLSQFMDVATGDYQTAGGQLVAIGRDLANFGEIIAQEGERARFAKTPVEVEMEKTIERAQNLLGQGQILFGKLQAALERFRQVEDELTKL